MVLLKVVVKWGGGGGGAGGGAEVIPVHFQTKLSDEIVFLVQLT